MGPVWDFDGALDNGSHTLTDYNYIVMKQRPWFECMIQDPVFVNKLCDRYKELRKGILSDENVKEKATEEGCKNIPLSDSTNPLNGG